ncbi:MAG: serine/threonine-protein phosphatase, partial [Acidobacteria bacterium]|nr:serine/threonine-protein phosphatase [Acidobacteriota bacterium]
MLECHALSDRGCCRRNNEDYCRIEPELGLYVLADGMGGARAGETAARLAVDTVVESVLSAGGRRDSQVLLSAVEEAHRRVIQAAGADPDLRGMGTTLLVVLETGQELVIASVGDSRAYLFEPGSGLSAITEDQTWVNEVGRPLGMDEESLRNHPMRHVLTMAIGAGASLTIHYYAVQMRPSSLLLLSTDGLHGVIEAGAIEEILGGAGCNGSLRQKCEQLI